ncbi:hypothetical protein SK128_006359 [Halocaridina rubra]|uniref:C2H2-type domain-containing protein n=1 Tax=Halocaridina rubra TaxID=373956 RepID=A0AAN8WW17_HALRR
MNSKLEDSTDNSNNIAAQLSQSCSITVVRAAAASSLSNEEVSSGGSSPSGEASNSSSASDWSYSDSGNYLQQNNRQETNKKEVHNPQLPFTQHNFGSSITLQPLGAQQQPVVGSSITLQPLGAQEQPTAVQQQPTVGSSITLQPVGAQQQPTAVRQQPALGSSITLQPLGAQQQPTAVQQLPAVSSSITLQPLGAQQQPAVGSSITLKPWGAQQQPAVAQQQPKVSSSITLQPLIAKQQPTVVQQHQRQQPQSPNRETPSPEARGVQKPKEHQQQSGEGIKCWECGASFQNDDLLYDHVALFHDDIPLYRCQSCTAVFPSQNLLTTHITTRHLLGASVLSIGHWSSPFKQATDTPKEKSPNLAQQAPKQETELKEEKLFEKEKLKPRGRPFQRRDFGCLYCQIKKFKSIKEFDAHHIEHVKQASPKVVLLQLDSAAIQNQIKVETRRRKKSSELKLKLKISKVGLGRGRKRKEVHIVRNEEGMSETQKTPEEQNRSEEEYQEEEEADSPAADNPTEEGDQSEHESEGENSRFSADLQRSSGGEKDPPTPLGHEDTDDRNERERDYEQEEQDSQRDSSEEQQQEEEEEEEEEPSPHQQQESENNYQNERQSDEPNTGNNTSGFETNFGAQELGFGAAGPSEAPSSTYQPQFESFQPTDWFNEYESGSRIAAAMAGASTADSAVENSWGGSSDGSNSAYGTNDSNTGKEGNSPRVNGRASDEDGLFSQAVLGQDNSDKNRQGSFEQLCLNDSYSGQSENTDEEQPDQQNVQEDMSMEQQQHQQASGVANDLLSELEYLNNSGQPSQGCMEGSPHSGGPSPHSGGPGTPGHLSSRGSNSGTPTSSGGHPTPPPADTSFRALATSPMTSPTQSTSPANLQGQSPPATSPLQQSGDQQQQQPGVPRLTIANNLMAPTTSDQLSPTTSSQGSVGGMMSRYSNQWPQGTGYSGSAGYGNMSGSNMSNSNMAGTLRAPLPPTVGMPYRPSPPARVRGRPPLMGQIGRPPLHQGSLLQPPRGPGRPPASSILPPPLMPAPGGRGGMMPPLQRMHQGMYQGQRQGGPQQQSVPGKRPLVGASHSPSKSARREDINVPSRQKDNECQIIAVANRADGLPVIANVQGGSGSGQRASSTPTSESTINLSDSITLSVRSSAGEKQSQRGERGGDAGTVANLLASRGITVTPAAGEKQDGGGRDDRRLPTAQELNLSSAISVHPPTQREREAVRERDRDGFAVPQAPVRGVSSNNVERPPRPPTVDLTQDVPSSGSHGTRHHCSQCDRTFPTASLLADHSRVHQQQQQSRMPYKCHLCTAGFSSQKGQQHHYQQFHQLHLSAGDIAIPLVDLRNPVNVQRMAALGIRSFLPLSNLQNRGAGGVVGVPILTLENLRNGHMTLQQWGVSDVLTLGPAKTLNMPRSLKTGIKVFLVKVYKFSDMHPVLEKCAYKGSLFCMHSCPVESSRVVLMPEQEGPKQFLDKGHPILPQDIFIVLERIPAC